MACIIHFAVDPRRYQGCLSSQVLFNPAHFQALMEQYTQHQK